MPTRIHWREDTDLVGICDAAVFAELAAVEQKAIIELRADVAPLMILEPTRAMERPR